MNVTILKMLISLMLAVALLGVVPAPANAANAPGPTRYWLVNDDELNAYTKNRGYLNYGVSRSFKVVEDYVLYVSPDGRYRGRDTLNCHRRVINYITVNVGRIGNTNPAAVTKRCKAGGVAFRVNIKDQVIWNASRGVDRCADVVVTFRWVPPVRTWPRQVVKRYPSICLPR